jgi:hypothetical protein
MINYQPSPSLPGNISGNAATVTGLSVATGKTLTVSKTITVTAPDDTAVATLPAGATTLLATTGSGAGLSGVMLPANTGTDISAIAAGTVYALTGTNAAVTFGSTSPAIVINAAGTYLIIATARLSYNGATIASNRTATLKLRRTNNTAADVGASRTITTDIVTAKTESLDTVTILAVYTTATATDAIELEGVIDVIPTVGTLDVTQAQIHAVRLK